MNRQVAKVGRWLVEFGCAYELAALQVERHLPAFSGWLPPLSRVCHRYRWHRLGTPLAGGLTCWLVWHLWVEKLTPAVVVVVPVVIPAGELEVNGRH